MADPTKSGGLASDLEKCQQLAAAGVYSPGDLQQRKASLIEKFAASPPCVDVDDLLLALVPLKASGLLDEADLRRIKAALVAPSAPQPAPAAPPAPTRLASAKLVAGERDLPAGEYVASKALGRVPFGRALFGGPRVKKTCPGCAAPVSFAVRQPRVRCDACGCEIEIEWELKGFDRIM